MSEETAAPQEAGAPDTSGLAIDLAMEEARADPSLRSDVAAFLRDQRSLIAIQKHHLNAQFRQILLGTWEKRLGVFLRLATLAVGLGVAAALGVMAWQAAHSRGLIVEPFSVPAEMTQRGLGGQVIASQMIDKLTAMTARESSRAAQSYANNWGDDAKVEIPETGVSIGELRRFLADWLGHDIRISGEVYRTATGIAVAARASGGDAGATFTGAEADLDALVQKLAEHVYEITQPYRYANYLDRNYDPVGVEDRVARATAIYNRLIAGKDPLERAWAYNGLGTIAFRFHGDNVESIAWYRKAIAAIPDFTLGVFALAARNGPLGEEEEFGLLKEASRLLHAGNVGDLNPDYVPYATLTSDSRIASYLGDFAAAIPLTRQAAELPDQFSTNARAGFINEAVSGMARRHDLAAARAYVREVGAEQTLAGHLSYLLEREDWPAMLAAEKLTRQRAAEAVGLAQNRTRVASVDFGRPVYALAHARQGDFSGAEALIAPVPEARDVGLRARAQIAAMQGQHARADWWFARAEAHAPSIPFADTLWGEALLARGDADAAIEKFILANQKGPKFADPLEGWGEALMAKNQSHLALAKFAEAEKYAPNWGRLHLKWGEALTYTGKKDEAAKHFARAAALDLTASEKSELARMNTHG